MCTDITTLFYWYWLASMCTDITTVISCTDVGCHNCVLAGEVCKEPFSGSSAWSQCIFSSHPSSSRTRHCRRWFPYRLYQRKIKDIIQQFMGLVLWSCCWAHLSTVSGCCVTVLWERSVVSQCYGKGNLSFVPVLWERSVKLCLSSVGKVNCVQVLWEKTVKMCPSLMRKVI